MAKTAELLRMIFLKLMVERRRNTGEIRNKALENVAEPYEREELGSVALLLQLLDRVSSVSGDL